MTNNCSWWLNDLALRYNKLIVPLVALIYCANLRPPALYTNLVRNSFRLWRQSALTIRQCCSVSEKLTLIPPVTVRTIERKSRFFCHFTNSPQLSMLAKPIRNTNRRFTDVESKGAILQRKCEVFEFTSPDSDILAPVYRELARKPKMAPAAISSSSVGVAH
jgi:hypothetical protein